MDWSSLPFLDTFGRDLLYYINTAKGIVAGLPPYATYGSYYPPLTTLLMVPLAFLPQVPLYFAWVLANLAMLVHLARGRRALAWAAFTPFLFTVVMGNMDFALVWIAQWLNRKDWKSVAAAVAITLKPQVAFVLLPYFLWKWLRTDRRKLAWFAGLAGAAHAAPLLLRPTILAEWVAAAASYGANSDNVATPGLFSFGLNPLTISLAVGIVLLALLSGREFVLRSALFFCLPAGHTYDAATLTMTAPAILLVPVSWIGLLLGPYTNGMSWFLLPAIVAGWNLLQRERRKSAPALFYLYGLRGQA
jgi:hypothetical protein